MNSDALRIYEVNDNIVSTYTSVHIAYCMRFPMNI